MASAESISMVQKMYVAYYGRPGDPAGVNYWADVLDVAGGNWIDSIVNDFGTSKEFTDQFGSLSNEELITNLYKQMFGRVPDAEGLAYYLGRLDSGESTLAELALDIANGAQGPDATVLDNKINVATYFTDEVKKTGTDYAGDANIDEAQAILAKVDGDPRSVVDGKVDADKYMDEDTTPPANTTFNLTDEVAESLVGTAGDDTFKGVVDGTAASPTLQVSDSIDGGAGTDTLNLIMVSNAPMPGGVTIENVEIVNLDVTATGADSSFLKTAAYEGVEQLWQVNNGTAPGNFADITVEDGVTAGFRGNGGVGTAAAKASASVSAAATQKELSVALDGVGSGSVITAVGAKLETVNISGSVGAASASAAGALTIDPTATAKTLNGEFGSDVVLTIAAAATKLETIDLSKSSGGVELDASGLTATLKTLKAGAGSDKITVDLGAKLETVDLGAGNDVLTLQDAASSAASDAVSITLGAGKDALVVSAAVNAQDPADLTNGLVTVTDFKLGDDTIDLSGVGGKTLTSAQLGAIAATTSLEAAATMAEGIIVGAATTSAVFSYGGNAYVLVADSTGGLNAGDGLIEITGLDAAQLSTGQNGGLVI